MASSDVRDVLNLGDSSGLRPSKKQKPTGARPSLKGLAREVLNLGGDNPIAIVPKTTQFKKRRFASRKPAAKWELLPFRNSGRDDQSLVLRHWRRKDLKDGEGAAGTGDQGQPQPPGPGELEDSIFAKFNVKIEVPQYTDDQYAMSLQNEDWTREETDYLMDMASQFDLRWTVIWDRYDWTPSATNGEMDVDGDESKAVVPTSRSRSLEDLKARYYEVAAKMMVIQKPLQYMTQQEYALHELMTHFNPKQEKVRKEFAVNTLSRSKEEAREEESLLLEIKRILARSERFNEERRELYNRLDYPRAETDISSFKSSAGLQTLLQTLMNVDKSKKRKSIMGTEGANTPSAGGGVAAATASAAAAAGAIASGASAGTQNRSSTGPETSRRDSAGASAAATRDSTTAASTPTTAGKKGQQQNQHHQQQQHLQQQQLQQQLQEKQQAPERRKLSSQEEAIYGVTHHDRLGSGPTFRTEKINKLFTHKSNQQQLRINNTLNELDVPAKLAMPTAATTAQYEQLLAAVNSLLDARKVSDKLDGEIKIEQAKKAEREKVHGATPSASGLGVDKKMSAQDEEVERDEDDDDDEEEEEDGDEDEQEDEDEEEDEEDEEEEEEEEGVEDDDDEEEEEPEPDDDEKTSASISIPTQKKPNNSGNDSENHGHGTASSVTVAQSGNKKGDSQAENTQDARKGRAHGQGQKGEEGGQTLSRSASSAFKRSASVLSSGSDVTVKKLKK
ncbi:swr complex subunit [Claviceps purpurea]|nr:swr complex subunit [Claviceps purpurea]KAG6317389.1 swr complex subunit [Claviceps purpurea]